MGVCRAGAALGNNRQPGIQYATASLPTILFITWDQLCGAGPKEQVAELLSELKDAVGSLPAAPQCSTAVPAESTSSEVGSEDEQVKELVERAALGDFDEVPSVPDLDEALRRQWHDQWKEPAPSDEAARTPSPTQLSEDVSSELARLVRESPAAPTVQALPVDEPEVRRRLQILLLSSAVRVPAQ
jgi:hypothetical protein